VKANLTASLPKLFIASAETTRRTFSAILNSTCTVPHENKVDVPSLRRNMLYLMAVKLQSRCVCEGAYIFHIFWNITHTALAHSLIIIFTKLFEAFVHLNTRNISEFRSYLTENTLHLIIGNKLYILFKQLFFIYSQHHVKSLNILWAKCSALNV
jgi:hypothetical protein